MIEREHGLSVAKGDPFADVLDVWFEGVGECSTVFVVLRCAFIASAHLAADQEGVLDRAHVVRHAV